MIDSDLLPLMASYSQSPPTPAGLACHLGMTITELLVYIKRSDEVGRALRYMLTEQLAFWQQRVSNSTLPMINYISKLLRCEF